MKRKSTSSHSSPTEITSLSAISHLVDHRPERILSLSVAAANVTPRVQALCDRAVRNGISVQKKKPDSEGPLRASVAPYVYADWREICDRLAEQSDGLVLALDHLQDPQNFGALCRTAEAFGIDAVITPQARSTAVTAAVYHASAGAIETLPIANPPNLGECLRRLKKHGFWILGTDLGEKSVWLPDAPRFEKTVLVLGSEGEGLSPLIRDLCDLQIAIPMRGKIQSLNVSAAGAVLMSHLRTAK